MSKIHDETFDLLEKFDKTIKHYKKRFNLTIKECHSSEYISYQSVCRIAINLGNIQNDLIRLQKHICILLDELWNENPKHLDTRIFKISEEEFDNG